MGCCGSKPVEYAHPQQTANFMSGKGKFLNTKTVRDLLAQYSRRAPTRHHPFRVIFAPLPSLLEQTWPSTAESDAATMIAGAVNTTVEGSLETPFALPGVLLIKESEISGVSEEVTVDCTS